MALKAILASLVPGLGHLVLRRHLQGVVFFAIFAASLNGVLVGTLWQDDVVAPRIFFTSATAAAVVWLFSVASVVRLALLVDREALARAREVKLREALTHYLRGENEQAVIALEAGRDLDLDGVDADILFHLGALRRRLGEHWRARRLFRRCLAVDVEGKWRWEVEQELKAMTGFRAGQRNGSRA